MLLDRNWMNVSKSDHNNKMIIFQEGTWKAH